MGEVRVLFGSLFFTLAMVACGSASTTEPATYEDPDAEAPRVPDPPPRYKPLQLTDAAPIDPDGGTELTIRCGRDKPYVCPLEDGTFACSSIPCIPDCSRIGCVGGEVCKACDAATAASGRTTPADRSMSDASSSAEHRAVAHVRHRAETCVAEARRTIACILQRHALPPVAEGLLRDGRYENQFEPGVTNGSPTAFPAALASQLGGKVVRRRVSRVDGVEL